MFNKNGFPYYNEEELTKDLIDIYKKLDSIAYMSSYSGQPKLNMSDKLKHIIGSIIYLTAEIFDYTSKENIHHDFYDLVLEKIFKDNEDLFSCNIYKEEMEK